MANEYSLRVIDFKIRGAREYSSIQLLLSKAQRYRYRIENSKLISIGYIDI